MNLEEVLIRHSEDYHTTPYVAEKALLVAIINRAIVDMYSFDLVARRDAYSWVNSNATNKFSFIWCTDHLDLDYQVMRDQINAYVKQQTIIKKNVLERQLRAWIEN